MHNTFSECTDNRARWICSLPRGGFISLWHRCTAIFGLSGRICCFPYFTSEGKRAQNSTVERLEDERADRRVGARETLSFRLFGSQSVKFSLCTILCLCLCLLQVSTLECTSGQAAKQKSRALDLRCTKITMVCHLL